LQAEHPVYWNVKEWCEGFRKLLDYLGLHKVHIFGASLGKNILHIYVHVVVPTSEVHIAGILLLLTVRS